MVTTRRASRSREIPHDGCDARHDDPHRAGHDGTCGSSLLIQQQPECSGFFSHSGFCFSLSLTVPDLPRGRLQRQLRRNHDALLPPRSNTTAVMPGVLSLLGNQFADLLGGFGLGALETGEIAGQEWIRSPGVMPLVSSMIWANHVTVGTVTTRRGSSGYR